MYLSLLQIWEQVALNDQEILSFNEEISNLDEENLCVQITEHEIIKEENLEKFQLLKDLPINSSKEETFMPSSEGEGYSSDENELDSGEGDLESDDACSVSSDEGMSSCELGKIHTTDGINSNDSYEGSNNDDSDGETNYNKTDGSDEDSDNYDEAGSDEINDNISDENSSDNEDDSKGSSSDSDDSAYDELDQQLYDKYIKGDESDEDEESDVEDIANASGEESDESDEKQQSVSDDESNDEDDKERPNKIQKMDSKGKKMFRNLNVPKFGESAVDSQFLNLRESEWVADEDIIGQEQFGDVDFMEDVGSDVSIDENSKNFSVELAH